MRPWNCAFHGPWRSLFLAFTVLTTLFAPATLPVLACITYLTLHDENSGTQLHLWVQFNGLLVLAAVPVQGDVFMPRCAPHSVWLFANLCPVLR